MPKKVNERQFDLFEDNSAKMAVATRKWSEFNEAIFEFYEKQKENILIQANAGSGKTTTLRELVSRTPKSLVLAFNSNTKKEFEERLKQEAHLLSGRKKPDAKVLTFHGLGYRSIISHVGPVERVSQKSERMMSLIKARYPELKYEKVFAVSKLTRYMRNFVKMTDKAWMNGIARAGIYDLWEEEDAAEAVEIATLCMEDSINLETCPKVIDFEDMNFIPFRQKWQLDHAQTIFVDETQDLSEVQIAMLWRSKARDARVVAVGDRFQCHPAGTMIRMPDGTERGIETLETGHYALGWNTFRQASSGKKYLHVGRRVYAGLMKVLRLDHTDVDMTPNHKLLVKWSPEAEGRYGLFYVQSRTNFLFEVIKLTESASYYENVDRPVCLVGHGATVFECLRLREDYLDGRKILTLDQIRIDLPLYPLPGVKAFYKAPWFPVYANSLFSGIFSVMCEDGKEVAVAGVNSYHYSGVVYSLDVADDHAYVANGIAVLNSIYAFRGADANAMTRVENSLHATVLPLPITYRCAQSIVRVASRFAPDIRARDGAPEGIIKKICPDMMMEMWRPGDLVISRANAPLVGYAICAMKQGIPAFVEGTAEDMGIDTLLRRFDRSGASFKDVLKAVREWGEEEKQRFLAVEDPDAAHMVDDRVATLMALASECSSSAEVMSKLRKLMSAANSTGSIRMSTVHKAKGSEADRVFMIMETFRLGGKDYIEAQEERNLYYVACTRAKTELYFVKVEK